MVFSSCIFLFAFLPTAYFANLLLPSIRAKNAALIVLSLFFYAFGEPVYVFLMLASVTVNYIFGLFLGESHTDAGRRKLTVTLAVVFNIGLLAVFKYAGFAVETLNALLPVSLPVPQIRLPIGISFFTFQALSYVIDVYRDASKSQKRYGDILLYVSLFPQLIAGPIIIYSDVAGQIRERRVTLGGTAAGIRRFICGLSKKLLLANTAGLIADEVFALNASGDVSFTAPLAWLGAIAYCLQIYYDFSGYSDMAIGIGHMLGFDFAENFQYPYTAVSVKDFWRRWHITLSSWFREYLYIPLGGNRCSKPRAAFNRMFVFLCTGLWHGASFNFLLWGLWHGTFLILEGQGIIPADKMSKSKLLRPLSRLYTLAVVLFGFVLFRAETLPETWRYISGMFGAFGGSFVSVLTYANAYNVFILLLAVVFSAPLLPWLRAKLGGLSERIGEYASYAGTAALLVLCVMTLATSTFNPFIYFRF